MSSSPAPGCSAPVIPWLDPQPLVEQLELGPGLEAASLRHGLVVLARQPQVQALVAFGSRARGEARPDSDLDLAVICREPGLTPVEKNRSQLWLPPAAWGRGLWCGSGGGGRC